LRQQFADEALGGEAALALTVGVRRLLDGFLVAAQAGVVAWSKGRRR